MLVKQVFNTYDVSLKTFKKVSEDRDTLRNTNCEFYSVLFILKNNYRSLVGKIYNELCIQEFNIGQIQVY